jgi:hypothetical protein
MDLTAPPPGRARLPAFDGGGIRGLFSLEAARRELWEWAGTRGKRKR